MLSPHCVLISLKTVRVIQLCYLIGTQREFCTEHRERNHQIVLKNKRSIYKHIRISGFCCGFTMIKKI